MSTKNRLPVNNIDSCLQQAQVISRKLDDPQQKDGHLCHVFSLLAGNATTGLLAYAIWRGRSELFSHLASISIRNAHLHR